ncbi:protein phosphatase 1 regulatory subunit 7-like protein [Vairimorpha apis BRL 01]|uniref:Protein phosphatase 1 regulatory subunit 7-like protein n=1 Tax=Vairimorpha apis BRL 01 TaxID=1037528 RepID=T0LA34_9MICR|nr:protein phosphatase 1 regulatory subunit 7-like protein [Vairimorpha apis BRL 01]
MNNDEDYIYLVHLKLTKIPLEIVDKVKIELRRNQISEMNFEYSEKTKYLDISDNKIKEMCNLKNLPNLIYLDLSYNLFKKINVEIFKLEELYLIGNDIEKITLPILPNLRILDLAGNNICQIENLNYIKNVKHLDKLQIFDLQNNLIEKLDCFVLPLSLKCIMLSDNKKLKSLDNIKLLNHLEVVGLERTNIKNIETNATVWYK